MNEPDPDQQRDDENDRVLQRQNLLVLAVVILLIILGVWLTADFRKSAQMEECREAGRHNCAVVDTDAGGNP